MGFNFMGSCGPKIFFLGIIEGALGNPSFESIIALAKTLDFSKNLMPE